MTPDDFLAFAKKNQVEMVDLKFVDMLGSWQHCSFPIDLWNADTFKEGLGFDGSSIRGWMGIHESDMLAIPDASTGCIDPFFSKPTLSVIANIVDPVTGKDFSRDCVRVLHSCRQPIRRDRVSGPVARPLRSCGHPTDTVAEKTTRMVSDRRRIPVPSCVSVIDQARTI